MNEKKNFSQKAAQFLAGRGFYIVLFVCTAVIGISAWVLLFPGETDTRSGNYVDYTDAAEIIPSPDIEAFLPAKTAPSPTPVPTPVPTPAPTPVPTPVPTPDTQDIEENMPSGSINDLTFTRPIAGDITMDFAIETLVYSRTLGDWRTHRGIDIAGALGAKVLAVCDGTVTEIYNDDLFGTTVVIDHGYELCSVYSNLAALPAVNVGDNVSLGSVIGAVGDTALGESGEVTHLHFEMKLAGVNVNPQEYINI